MPRSRTNDPSNLPAAPNPVTDPVREAELVEEFKKRLTLLHRSFQMGRLALADDKVAFNASLERLRRGLARKRKAKRRGDRLHPEVEMVITRHARALAGEESVDVAQRHVQQAGEMALGFLRPRRGRPDDRLLELHVKGLVALVQEMSGTPVIACRYRNSLYDPHFAEGVSQLIPVFFRGLDESITVARLVRIVGRIRSEYAGKPLRFFDFFPFYGASTGDDGEIRLRPGYRLEAFQPNIPIYCP